MHVQVTITSCKFTAFDGCFSGFEPILRHWHVMVTEATQVFHAVYSTNTYVSLFNQYIMYHLVYCLCNYCCTTATFRCEVGLLNWHQHVKSNVDDGIFSLLLTTLWHNLRLSSYHK
jgi:hypothetical protein